MRRLPWRLALFGLRAHPLRLSLLFVAASCLHATAPSVTPRASLMPESEGDAQARSKSPFAVVHAAPRGRVTDRKQPGVTVLFSRGMRSIDTPDTDKLPPISVRTKTGAPVRGSWSWMGTRGLVFAPDGYLPGGSDVVVTIPAGTPSLDGAKLAHEYSLGFSTDGPAVTNVWAGQRGRTIPTDATFRVRFDQPVDLEAVRAAVSLRVFAGDGDKGEVVPLKLSPTSPPDAAGGTLLDLKPTKELPTDREVELTIAPSLRGLEGPRPMGNAAVFAFHTRGPLRIVDFYCPRIQTMGRCRAGGDLKVRLSNPVAPDEFRSHLVAPKVPPRPPTKADKKPRSIEATDEHWLGVSPKLGQQYRVTVKAGMRDVYGQKLAKDASFDVVVEAPLVRPPGAETAKKAPAADPKTIAHKADAPRPPQTPKTAAGDTRPRRERLPYKLELGVSGSVLEAGVDQGVRSHRIPVGAVNIPTYSTIASPLNEAQALTWTTTRGRSGEFLSRNLLTPSWTTTDAAENERAVDFIDLNAGLSSRRGKGPVFLRIAAPGEEGATESVVNVTDLGVSAKLGPFGGLVWVTHLSTGKPVSDATVTIRTEKSGDTRSLTTDADGVAVIPIDLFDAMAKPGSSSIRDDAILVVRSGDDWTFQRIARSTTESRATSGFNVLMKQSRWAGIVYADRGVYRPGETAKVGGIVRVADEVGLRVVPGREVRIELKDANGEQVFDGRAASDAFGTFAIDVPIPKTTQLGAATLSATTLPGGASHTSEAGVFSNSIRILHYQADKFKVTADIDKTSYVRGDTAHLEVQAQHLFGGPMAGGNVSTKVTRQAIGFKPDNTDGFSTHDGAFTSDYSESSSETSPADDANGILDSDGRFRRDVDLDFDDQKQTERLVFEATAQDPARREVSARAQALLHPAEFFLGVRDPKDRFVAAGAPYRAEVLVVTPTGSRRPGVPVKVELVERRWTGVVTEQPDGTPLRSSSVTDSVVGTCSTVTTTTTAFCNVRVPSAGYFILRATASDARNHTVRASTSFYGTEQQPQAQARTAWPANDSKVLKLEGNKPNFDIGETARFVVRSPFREGEALVTAERNGVLFQKVVPLSGPMPIVTIPVRSDFYPNVYIGVHLVRGRIAPPPAAGADLGSPDFRVGYAELRVNPEAHRLHVDIAQPKTEYGPGQEVDADVHVSDAAGKPAKSALTFYAVDEGVLALTTYRTPDPLPSFALSRKLSVFTMENRELLAQILPLKAKEKLNPLGFEYALASNPANSGYDKGEDGGDGDDPTATKRKDFRATAYFEAGRKTDQEGKAHFHFKLPDNLTTFRLMAIAAGEDDRFGAGESKLSTSRRLMAEPALPRIVRVGDAFDASVVVSSKSSDEASKQKPSQSFPVQVKIETKGLELSGGPASRSVQVRQGEQVEVRFPVRAKTPGDAIVAFAVRSGTDSDNVEAKRTVDLPMTMESVGIYGETTKPTAIRLGDLKGIRGDRGGLTLRVSSSALAGIGTTLDHLFEYPYGCTEQVVSSTLPLLAAIDLARDFGAKLPSDVGAMIDGGIEKILANQQSDGGFGYWSEGGTSSGGTSDPWLSAYAMMPLLVAREQKRLVPRDAVERGRDYLTSQLYRAVRNGHKQEDGETEEEEGRQGQQDQPGQQDQKEPTDGEEETAEAREKRSGAVDFTVGAFTANVLAMTGSKNPGSINLLYDHRRGQRLSAQAALLSAMVRTEMDRAQQTTLAREIEARLRVGPNDVDVDEADYDGYFAVLDSHARTLALALQALLAYDAHHPLAARMASRLMNLRQNGAWRTTQEDAWGLLALADYHKAQEANSKAFSARVFLGQSPLFEGTFPEGGTREDRATVAASTLLASKPTTVSFDLLEPGRLFYAVDLRYATSDLPKRARDEGLFVRKALRPVATTDVQRALTVLPGRSSDVVKAGDLVLVDLIFESAEARHQVVVDDPLPAGLEALDYELDTTAQATRSEHTTGSSTPSASGKGGKPTKWLGTTFSDARFRREVRDDRVLTFFDTIEPGMYRVQYLARAVNIGSFVMPPTRIECMYDPEVYGSTAGSTLVVRPKG